jgi:hypothetical protein
MIFNKDIVLDALVATMTGYLGDRLLVKTLYIDLRIDVAS